MSSLVESGSPSNAADEHGGRGGAIVVHYSEIGLKGNNRGFFVNTLVRNLRHATRGLPVSRVSTMYGRLMIHLREGIDEASVREIRLRLRFIPGVANYSVASTIPVGNEFVSPIERDPTWLALRARAWDVVRQSGARSFVVRVKRPEKLFPLTSLEMERLLGAELLRSAEREDIPLRVNLTEPEVTCRVEMLRPYAFVYGLREYGPGGLPVGSSGRLVSLLSAGFDSPVASYLMMKRGAEVVYVHFYGYPLTDSSSADHVRDLAEVLGKVQPRTVLYLVPFGLAQQEIISATPRALRMVIYRRLMMRIASEIARREKALGLVTGESLGQVASQTLNNLAVIEEAAEIPVYRPLIGLNKDEIIALSEKIGTHDISAEPTPDCCSLMVARHPVTKAEMRMVEPVEAQVDMARLVVEALGRAEVVRG